MYKSTTNDVLILITMAAIGFLLANLVMNAIWMKVEIDPILAGFMSSIIWFVIAKKWAKTDWNFFVEEEIKKQKTIKNKSKDPMEKVDNILWISYFDN